MMVSFLYWWSTCLGADEHLGLCEIPNSYTTMISCMYTGTFTLLDTYISWFVLFAAFTLLDVFFVVAIVAILNVWLMFLLLSTGIETIKHCSPSSTTTWSPISRTPTVLITTITVPRPDLPEVRGAVGRAQRCRCSMLDGMSSPDVVTCGQKRMKTWWKI